MREDDRRLLLSELAIYRESTFQLYARETGSDDVDIQLVLNWPSLLQQKFYLGTLDFAFDCSSTGTPFWVSSAT